MFYCEGFEPEKRRSNNGERHWESPETGLPRLVGARSEASSQSRPYVRSMEEFSLPNQSLSLRILLIRFFLHSERFFLAGPLSIIRNTIVIMDGCGLENHIMPGLDEKKHDAYSFLPGQFICM